MSADSISDLARARKLGADAGNPKDPIDRAAAMKRARERLSAHLADRTAPSYPVDALGPLAAACKAIAHHGQVQPAMVGQCLLGAASLLVEGLANVETLNGPRPLSLYLLTLGDSGDGKSTAQRAALHPVNEWQREASHRHQQELKQFEQSKSDRKRGDDPATPPASPYRLVSDATVEGLRRELTNGPVAQGLFSDEAAAILSGYGMSTEQRGKSGAVFNRLWDCGHLSVSRASGDRVERYGSRLAMHWLLQPTAAGNAIADPMLTDLGFWPRFLLAWPTEAQPRRAEQFRPELLEHVVAYWARCNELLRLDLPQDADQAPLLKLDEDARQFLAASFERFELQARRGPLRSVKPFALRAAEQAARVAGVLTAFGGRQTVDLTTMKAAIQLVAYSLESWRALTDEGVGGDAGARALRLYEWLIDREGQCEALSVIVNRGPSVVRSKARRDEALLILHEVGLVDCIEGKAIAQLPGEEGHHEA